MGAVQINHDAATKGLFVESKQGGDGLLIVKSYELSLTMTVLHEGSLGFNETGNFMVGQFPYSLQGSGVNFLQNDSEGTPRQIKRKQVQKPVKWPRKPCVADKVLM